MKRILISIFMISALLSVKAEIVVPKIFSDNMVLQRLTPVKIWGKANANAVVGIAFASQKVETKAKEDGSWAIHLRPLKASQNPLTMHFYEDGYLSKEIKNVLVGEVWVAGGQSNMQFSLSQLGLLKKDLGRGNKPMIRMFTQKYDAASKIPEFDSPEDARWEMSTTEKFRSFSALAFFFAEEISSKLKVPVGIVQTACNSSKMIAHLAMKDVEDNPFFANDMKKFLDLYEENYDYEETFAEWTENRKEFQARKKKATKANEPFTEIYPQKPSEFSKTSLASSPSYLYNAKIAPIAGYTVRGFLWYQGESDVGNSELFAGKFETLIRSWRKYWDKPMPFYFVQLPSYKKAGEGWVETRWQQYLTKQKLRLVEMAVSLDTGEKDNIHPPAKEEVADRLAKIAQKRIYNNRFMTGEYGPMLKKVNYQNNIAIVNFNTNGRKLEQKGELRGFEILVDEDWVLPAEINLDVENANVILTAPEGEEILAVRHLWKAWAKPDISLYSDLKLPAMPFIDEKKAEADSKGLPSMPKAFGKNKRNENLDSDRKILPVLEKRQKNKKPNKKNENL